MFPRNTLCQLCIVALAGLHAVRGESGEVTSPNGGQNNFGMYDPYGWGGQQRQGQNTAGGAGGGSGESVSTTPAPLFGMQGLGMQGFGMQRQQGNMGGTFGMQRQQGNMRGPFPSNRFQTPQAPRFRPGFRPSPVNRGIFGQTRMPQWQNGRNIFNQYGRGGQQNGQNTPAAGGGSGEAAATTTPAPFDFFGQGSTTAGGSSEEAGSSTTPDPFGNQNQIGRQNGFPGGRYNQGRNFAFRNQFRSGGNPFGNRFAPRQNMFGRQLVPGFSTGRFNNMGSSNLFGRMMGPLVSRNSNRFGSQGNQFGSTGGSFSNRFPTVPAFGGQNANRFGNQNANRFGNQNANRLGSQNGNQNANRLGSQNANRFGNQNANRFGSQNANRFGSQTSGYGGQRSSTFRPGFNTNTYGSMPPPFKYGVQNSRSSPYQEPRTYNFF